MSDANVELPKLQRLIDRLLDDRLADDEVDQLNELLRDNPAAQQLLIDYCQFHSILTFDCHAARVIDRFDQERKKTQVSQVSRWFGGRIARRVVYSSLLALAASLLVAAVLPWGLGPKPVLFKVDGIGLQVENNVFRIESGITEIKLAKVGSVFLQGPAELEMISPSRARLKHGRIRMRVSDPRGKGFVVEMPNGEVTDLGTEFGVDVVDGGKNELVVFDGAVDLRIPASAATTANDYVEHLVRGDGVSVGTGGELERIMAIFTGSNATFGRLSDARPEDELPIIVDVKDNLGRSETRKFYEIVPRGLDEDVLAYADRPQHEWNGITVAGMPQYLIGADYVKPFNNDKMRKDFELSVTLSRPARLFIFFDDRIPVPDWLMKSFKDTKDDLAIDVGGMVDMKGRWRESSRGIGPGVNVDNHYSIWERVVSQPGTVNLGANAGQSSLTAMYGVAAVAIDPKQQPLESATGDRTSGDRPVLPKPSN